MNYNIQSVIRIVFFIFLSVNNIYTLTFVNRESSFILHTVGGITSRFRLGPSTVNGWSDGSIRKDNNISQFNLRNEAFNSGGDYIITSSSAREDLVNSNSNAIVKLAVSGSDLAINNSNLLNVLAPLVKQSSNAINAIEKTSNLAVLVRTTSNTVNIATPLIVQNSNAINAFGTTSNFAVLVRTTSNTVNVMTPLVKQNSNAIVELAVSGSDLAINNSNLLNVLAPLVKQSSNAINALEKTSNLAGLVRTTSNTVNIAMPLVIHNSNAINAFETTSNFATLVRTTSNAVTVVTPLVKQNSSAVVNLAATSSDLAISNSNVINVLAPLVKQNSNAIINNIGVPDTDVFFPSYFFIFDYFVSPDSLFRTHADVTIDGGGHFMIFARNKPNTFQIDPGTTVILTDVVLKDFSDAVVQLGAGSKLIFGPGTVIELASTDTLLRDWSLFGNVIVNGNGHYLNLAGYSLQLAQNGSLVLQNVQLQNVAGNNLRCVGDVGLITLQGSSLYLSSDFSYTTGSLRFDGDVVISGTSSFNYTSNQASTVAGHSLLFLDAGLTFKYAPGTDNRNLIVFEDVTSRLFLDGCTLLSTTTGLRLTRGTLLIDNKNYFFNSGATALSEGISFGNGIILDDLTINILPGASIVLESGIINYDNVGL